MLDRYFCKAYWLTKNFIKKYFRKWNNLFSKWFIYLSNNITPIQYCLNDLINHDFNQIIIGIKTKDNLKEIVNFKVFKKNLKYMNLENNDLSLIDPRKWKKI